VTQVGKNYSSRNSEMTLEQYYPTRSFRKPMTPGRQVSPSKLHMLEDATRYFVQPKLDGMHAMVLSTDKVLGKHGQEISKFSLWRDDLRMRAEFSAWGDVQVAGELCKVEGKETFYPFDIITYQGGDVSRTAYSERLKILNKWVARHGVMSFLPRVDDFIIRNTQFLPQHLPDMDWQAWFTERFGLRGTPPIEGVVLKHFDNQYMGLPSKSIVKARWE
jgi:hypothetical protein